MSKSVYQSIINGLNEAIEITKRGGNIMSRILNLSDERIDQLQWIFDNFDKIKSLIEGNTTDSDSCEEVVDESIYYCYRKNTIPLNLVDEDYKEGEPLYCLMIGKFNAFAKNSDGENIEYIRVVGNADQIYDVYEYTQILYQMIPHDIFNSPVNKRFVLDMEKIWCLYPMYSADMFRPIQYISTTKNSVTRMTQEMMNDYKELIRLQDSSDDRRPLGIISYKKWLELMKRDWYELYDIERKMSLTEKMFNNGTSTYLRKIIHAFYEQFI